MEPSPQTLILRGEARAEVERVRLARAAQLARILRAGLSARDMAVVVRFNESRQGILGELWDRFIGLPLQAQIEALGELEFEGMAWQSLLQCNPYARLPSWERIELRPYR